MTGMNGPESSSGAAAVAGRYAGALLDHLRSRGIDPAALYSAAQITAIEGTGATRLPADEYLDMLRAAASATGDPDLGFKTGMSVRPRHLGVVGQILMSCADVGEALTQYDRYVRLVHGLTRPLALRRGSRVEMPLDWPAGSVPPPALAQLIMTSRVGMVRLLTGRADMPCDVDFQFPRPRRAAQYEKFFGGRVRFSCRQTRLGFAATYLKLPILLADAQLARTVRAQAEALIRKTGDTGDEPEFLRALRGVLDRGMVVGRAAAADAARALGISSRTLHRRLGELDCNFRDVLDGVRRERAEHYLRRAQSLAEIAFMLGYTEQSAFQHAFKRWTGLTPGVWRQHAADG